MSWKVPAAKITSLLPERSSQDWLLPLLEGKRPPDAETLTRRLQSVGIDPTDCFFAAVCIGMRPDFAKQYRDRAYSEYSLKNLSLYRALSECFREDGLGTDVSENMHCIRILCAFPGQNRRSFVEKHLQPVLKAMEDRFDVPLLIGIGRPVYAPEEIRESCESAERMFRLFFYEEESIIDYRDHSSRRQYQALDDYDAALERAFRSILLKSPSALDEIVAVLDALSRFHYGNRSATLMFAMDYTGEISSRLNRYRLLHVDFFQMQDRLQEKVIHAATFSELKIIIRQHFQELLPHVYANDRPKGKLVVEQLKDYIREHYMEELTVQKMAAMAYVSEDYFTHMFKNETGKNFKAFLTEIRMKQAVDLLRETEFRVAEISERVGYNNTRAFVDAFKQTYSVSPMGYRRIHRNQDTKVL